MPGNDELGGSVRMRAICPPGTSASTRLGRTRGFTIMELLVTVMVGAILVDIGMPQLNVFLQDNARTACINTMVSSMSYARTQAITRNEQVSLCEADTTGVSSGGTVTACTSTGGNFKNGWIVFSDADGAGDVDAGIDDIIRIFQPQTCDGSTVTVTGSAQFVSFRNNGMTDQPGAFFRHCDSREQVRGVMLLGSGQARAARSTDSIGSC